MKIAFFTHYTTLYGANRSLLNLLDHLISLGVEPLVIAPNLGELTNVLTEKKINYIVHHFKSDFIDKSSYKGVTGYKKRLKLIYYNFRKAHIIAEALKDKGINLIYTNSSVMYVGFFVSKMLKLPHLWHIREFAELQYGLTPNSSYHIFKFFLSKSSAKVFVSESLRRYYIKGNDENSFVVYNGIATKEFFLRYENIKSKSLTKPNAKVVFCLVGQINSDKGQIDAIKALEKLNKLSYNLELVIAGDGNTTTLTEYIIDKNITNVKILGHVDDSFKVFSSSDVTLMCSKNEAMGRVTIESMCVKTPVIGLNNAGTSELIEHNITGLLYDGTIEDLAHQMQKMIIDAELRSRLAENGWYWAYQNFNQEKYGDEVYSIIKDILN